MWRHRHASNVSLVPSSSCDMALSWSLLKEQHVTCSFPHCDQRLAVARAVRGRRRGKDVYLLPFLLLISPFFLFPPGCSIHFHLQDVTTLPVFFCVHCSACCACLSNMTQQQQWHHSSLPLKETYIKENKCSNSLNNFHQHLQDMHICACILACQTL